jgi:hypothetical protein
MNKSPKEKAKELFNQYHNLIQDIGGDMGQEILVSILAKESCLIAVDEIIDSHYKIKNFLFNEIGYLITNPEYWQEVKQEINNL